MTPCKTSPERSTHPKRPSSGPVGIFSGPTRSGMCSSPLTRASSSLTPESWCEERPTTGNRWKSGESGGGQNPSRGTTSRLRRPRPGTGNGVLRETDVRQFRSSRLQPRPHRLLLKIRVEGVRWDAPYRPKRQERGVRLQSGDGARCAVRRASQRAHRPTGTTLVTAP